MLFLFCKNLTSITIPDSVTSIDGYAFSGCSALTFITIPNSISVISDGCFRSSGLTSITIPDSVTSIGSYAFSGCHSLTSIIIPNSVLNIGTHAFGNCTELTNVYCYAENIPIVDNPFDGSFINYANLYVPKSSIEEYKTTDPWKQFKTIKPIEETNIRNYEVGYMTINNIYRIDGIELESLHRGINIIRMNNGEIKKILIK